MNCKGPCLPHCYNKYSYFFLIAGLVLGATAIYLYSEYKKNKDKK